MGKTKLTKISERSEQKANCILSLFICLLAVFTVNFETPIFQESWDKEHFFETTPGNLLEKSLIFSSFFLLGFENSCFNPK